MNAFLGKNIIVGVSGGIAAYKSCEIVRLLKKAGAHVTVVMTEAAAHFVGPLTFQALSGNKVYLNLMDEDIETGMGHIALARWADAILLAPLTANSMANLALGQATDLLSTLCLATKAPIAFAPAMNTQMWLKPIVQQHLKTLQTQGYQYLGIGEGEQACGELGPGRLLEPMDILNRFEPIFSNQQFAGKRVVVTAGPTREYLDPVRFLSNPSTGKMGYAIAQAFQEAGAVVDLISGPVAIAAPENVTLHAVETAEQMHQAAQTLASGADLFVATAAVGDYVFEKQHTEKLATSKTITVTLNKTPDILASVAALKDKPYCVGFAAQTHDHMALARKKLRSKNIDMICMNDVSQVHIGFASEDNALTVITHDQETHLNTMPKTALAKALLTLIKEHYENACCKV